MTTLEILDTSNIQEYVWKNISKMNRTFLQDDLKALPLLGGGSIANQEMPYFASSMDWTCVPGFNAPMRVNENGDVECMSLNAKDCMWGGSCDVSLSTTPGLIRPLTCGEDHKRQWGGTGYENPNHWCSQVRDQLGLGNTNKEMLDFVFGDTDAFRARFGLDGAAPALSDITRVQRRVIVAGSQYQNLPATLGDADMKGVDAQGRSYEYNFTTYLKSVGTPGAMDLLTLLNGLRVLYNFLDVKKYRDYILLANSQVQSYEIAKYDPAEKYSAARSSTGITRATVNNDINALLGLGRTASNDLIIDQKKTNHIVLRRYILLLELMIHIKIALAMFDSLGPDADGSTPSNGSNQLRLIQSNLDILIRLNNLSMDYTKSRLGGEAISRYNRLTESISTVDDELKDNRRALTAQQGVFARETDKSNRAGRAFYTVATFTVVLLLVAFTLILMPGVADRTKVVGVSAIFVVLIAIAIAVRYVYAKTYEYFLDGILFLPLTIENVVASIYYNHDDIMDKYHATALQEANRFLNETINIGYDMASTQVYSSVNNSIQKELTYFDRINGQVKSSTEQINELGKVRVLSAVTNSSNVMFVIYIGLVIMAALILVLLTPDSTRIHTIIYWIAGTMVLLITVFFMMNVLRRVRTDARQLYWQKPSVEL